jgi:hypothetical protein
MPKNYKITMVERWTFLNDQRNPVDGYRVTFSIPNLAVIDHVVLAEAAYTPDNVKKAITDKVVLHRTLLDAE